MQVFRPYARPFKNANVLDKQRRNKQILETIQIISANTGIDVGWKIPKYVYKHPNTLMWKGYESYLCAYLFRLFECYQKDHENDKHHKYTKFCFYHKSGHIFWKLRAKCWTKDSQILPPWFSKESCYEHQALLIEKDSEYYGPIFNKYSKEYNYE